MDSDTARMQALDAKGANVCMYVYTFICTHMHTCRMDGDTARMQALYAKGANTNYRSPEANFATALLVACEKGDTKLFETLMELKANVNERDQVCMYACMYV
jgi:hypothetical protein